jgi:hypothetical protein
MAHGVFGRKFQRSAALSEGGGRNPIETATPQGGNILVLTFRAHDFGWFRNTLKRRSFPCNPIMAGTARSARTGQASLRTATSLNNKSKFITHVLAPQTPAFDF